MSKSFNETKKKELMEFILSIAFIFSSSIIIGVLIFFVSINNPYSSIHKISEQIDADLFITLTGISLAVLAFSNGVLENIISSHREHITAIDNIIQSMHETLRMARAQATNTKGGNAGQEFYLMAIENKEKEKKQEIIKSDKKTLKYKQNLHLIYYSIWVFFICFIINIITDGLFEESMSGTENESFVELLKYALSIVGNNIVGAIHYAIEFIGLFTGAFLLIVALQRMMEPLGENSV